MTIELDTAAAVRSACARVREHVPAGGTFTLDGIARVRVDMSSRDDLEWLAAYVAPHYAFSERVDGACAAHVTELVDGDCQRHLRDLTGAWSWRERALYQDEPVLEAQQGDVRLHVNRRRPLVTVFEPGLTTIVSDPADPEARMEPIRHVREVMTKRLEAAGWFVYHMASVAIEGIGVGLVGGKGAGKSSLALGACARGALLISNDRSYIGATGSGARIRSWPTTAAIGIGTLSGFPELHRWLAAPERLDYQPQDRYLSGVSLDAALALPLDERAALTDKLELTCAEVARSFGTSLCAEAPLGLIVVPELAIGSSPAELRAAPPDVARALLHSQVYTPHDPRYPDWLDERAVPVEDLERQSSAQVATILATVPVVRLRYSDAREAGAALTEYVARMG